MGTKAEQSGRWRARCDGCDTLGDWVLPNAGAIVDSLPEYRWVRVMPGMSLCPPCAKKTVD